MEAEVKQARIHRRGWMNGIHDMGGMQGAGPIAPEHDEPVFHELWEKKVFAMQSAASGQGLYRGDEFRHAIERMNWLHYLESSYYEHWLTALETLLSEKGIISREELEARVKQVKEHPEAIANFPPSNGSDQLASRLEKMVRQGGSTRRETGTAPRFKPGDKIAVRNINPDGHTRLPRYIRGKRGTIEKVHGSFNLPDTNAHGQGKNPQPVYTVRFDAREVWGEQAAVRDTIYVDLWESYLEPAS
jgi:nitrile hydratase subunit beta